MIVEPPTTGLERIFRAEVAVGRVDDYGLTSVGHRRVIQILGGRLSQGIDAEILGGGADWQVVRADGTLEIDGRYSARTRSGAFLYLRARGIRSGPPEVLAAILDGQAVEPDAYYFRTVVDIETSDPGLAYLQRAIIVAAAARTADSVIYDAYRVL
jgi:hypothetical protein